MVVQSELVSLLMLFVTCCLCLSPVLLGKELRGGDWDGPDCWQEQGGLL